MRDAGESFGTLYARYYRDLCLVAASEVGRSDAEDVVQDAFVAASKRFGRYEQGTDFRAWMVAFVRNAARNHRRGTRRRMRREAAPRLVGSASSCRDGQREDHAGLDEAMSSLNEAQRACLLLRVVGERSYEQIGLILSIPSATARSHVMRARARLAGVLAESDAGGEG